MTEMTWAEPPTDRRKGADRKWRAVTAELRANPGKWALVENSGAVSLTTRINQGVYPAFRPAGDYEATGRAHADDNKYDIYARYVGFTPSESAAHRLTDQQVSNLNDVVNGTDCDFDDVVAYVSSLCALAYENGQQA